MSRCPKCQGVECICDAAIGLVANARRETMREIVDVLRRCAVIFRDSATKMDRYSRAELACLTSATGMDGAIAAIDAWWASKEGK